MFPCVNEVYIISDTQSGYMGKGKFITEENKNTLRAEAVNLHTL